MRGPGIVLMGNHLQSRVAKPPLAIVSATAPPVVVTSCSGFDGPEMRLRLHNTVLEYLRNEEIISSGAISF